MIGLALTLHIACFVVRLMLIIKLWVERNSYKRRLKEAEKDTKYWKRLAKEVAKKRRELSALREQDKKMRLSLIRIANNFRVQGNEKKTGKVIYLEPSEIVSGDFSRTTKAKGE